MENDTIIIFLFGFVIFISLIILYFYNHLLLLKKQVLKKYEAVSFCLTTMQEKMSDIITFIEKNLEHEEDYIRKLSNIQKKLSKISNTDGGLKELKRMEKEYLKFTELDTIYPFLKKNNTYLELKKFILLYQTRVEYALDIYNEGVNNYNRYQKNEFVKKINKLFSFPNYDYYRKES